MDDDALAAFLGVCVGVCVCVCKEVGLTNKKVNIYEREEEKGGERERESGESEREYAWLQ